MCGIAGFLNYPEKLEPFINSVAQIQGHRGPDHQAVWRADGIALCHQRLSIIDLSEDANQPMTKHGLTIIFNGEIYNYEELRQNLTKQNQVSFNTHSDTEVVLESYRLLGHECLDTFKGMFAFAIYNEQTQSLFIARDPFGIKPLFYTKNNLQFSFASELKTLVQMPGFEKNINQRAMVAAINYLWLPQTECMFMGVNKLAAGSYILCDSKGQTKIVKYYQPVLKVVDRSIEETIHLLDVEIQASVKRHMVADVPVSTFLSGGLDSSLISVLAQQHNPKLSTYSISILPEDQKVEQMPDDAKYANILAKKFGFDHHEVTITPKITDYLPKMVYHLDEPIGDPAAINTYIISLEAKNNGSKVLLSGMGADEIFFGYRRQLATLMAQKYQKMPVIIQKSAKWVANKLPVQIAGRGFKLGRWAQRFTNFASLPLSEAYMRSYSYYDTDSENALFTHDIRSDMNNLVMEHDLLFNQNYPNDPINQMCNTDISMFMNGLNLTYTDRASMAASVEVRVPFIDKDVVELAMSINGSFKFHGKEQKNILKKVAENYLPKEIIYRPKASFSAPIRSWISGSLSEMVDDQLSEENLKNRGIFEPKIVLQIIESNRKGRKDNAYQIYQLLTIELWYRAHYDNTGQGVSK